MMATLFLVGRPKPKILIDTKPIDNMISIVADRMSVGAADDINDHKKYLYYDKKVTIASGD